MSSPSSVVYLMYHELELPGRPLCQDEPGYVRYIVRECDFRSQMQLLQESGWHGMSVTQALDRPRPPGVVITLDDGCETDLLTAAPLLRELGFGATFYVTVGFLGQRGYLSRGQLRELRDAGFEIGSHSMSHPYLSDLDQERLTYELAASKSELEEITGHPVQHFSCPGGRWDRRIAESARKSGYRSVATSHIVANSPTTDRYALGRVAIMRGTSLGTFRDVSKGHGLWAIRIAAGARSSMRQLLGNSLYDRLRARALVR